MSSRDPPSCPCKRLPQCLSSFTAAEYGSLDTLVRLGPSVVDKIDAAGYSPLHLAAQNGHVAATCLLLKMGLNVDGKIPSNDAKSSCGATPLHRASFAGAVSTMKILLEWRKGERCDVLARDTSFGDRMTPLHKAAAGGRYLAVQLLLDSIRERDEEVRVPDMNPDDEPTLLWRACTAKDAQGRTPLMTAESLFVGQIEHQQEVRRWDRVAGGSADWGKCIELLRAIELELKEETGNGDKNREGGSSRKRSPGRCRTYSIPDYLMSGSVGSCLECSGSTGDGRCPTASWEAAFQSVLAASVDKSIGNQDILKNKPSIEAPIAEVALTKKVCEDRIDDKSPVGQHCSSCGVLCFALCPSIIDNTLVCRTCASHQKRRKTIYL